MKQRSLHFFIEWHQSHQVFCVTELGTFKRCFLMTLFSPFMSFPWPKYFDHFKPIFSWRFWEVCDHWGRFNMSTHENFSTWVVNTTYKTGSFDVRLHLNENTRYLHIFQWNVLEVVCLPLMFFWNQICTIQTLPSYS